MTRFDLEKERILQSPLRFIPYAVNVWCVLLPTSELGSGRIRKMRLLGVDYAIFRSDSGALCGVEDRCPHRGIELSLGTIEDNHIRCAYHGWCVDGSSGRILRKDCSSIDDQQCTRHIALRERHGLVWAFIGNPDIADAYPLPILSGFGLGKSVDMIIRKPIAAHWSYVFDNGIDLFHYGLHENVPFFFRIQNLVSYEATGDKYRVHYRAEMPDYMGRTREGDLFIETSSNLFSLDMGGDLRVHGVATPVSANGRILEMWWFVSVFAPAPMRLFLRAIKPLILRQVTRGFQQDVAVLESEQRAFDRGLRFQRETNPAVHAAHDYLKNYIADCSQSMSVNLKVESVPFELLRSQALRGELGIVCVKGGKAEVIDPELESNLLHGVGKLDVRRYQHFVLIEQ